MENTNHKVTQFLLFLHTQETFLYKDLKSASRKNDESKIIPFGPYSLALSYILANAKNNKNKESKCVYRGMRIPK